MSFNLSNVYRNIINDILLHDSRLHLIDLITKKKIYKVCKFYAVKTIMTLKLENDKILSISNNLLNANDSNLMEVIIEITKEITNEIFQSNSNNFSMYFLIGFGVLSSYSTKINEVFKKTNYLQLFKTEYLNIKSDDNKYKKTLLINFLSSLFARTLVIYIDEIGEKILIDEKLKIDDNTEENVFRFTKEIESICEDNDIFDQINN